MAEGAPAWFWSIVPDCQIYDARFSGESVREASPIMPLGGTLLNYVTQLVVSLKLHLPRQMVECHYAISAIELTF